MVFHAPESSKGRFPAPRIVGEGVSPRGGRAGTDRMRLVRLRAFPRRLKLNLLRVALLLRSFYDLPTFTFPLRSMSIPNAICFQNPSTTIVFLLAEHCHPGYRFGSHKRIARTRAEAEIMRESSGSRRVTSPAMAVPLRSKRQHNNQPASRSSQICTTGQRQLHATFSGSFTNRRSLGLSVALRSSPGAATLRKRQSTMQADVTSMPD